MGDRPPFSGPVRVEVTAAVAMPASAPKRDRLTAQPIRRPDLDNYIKLALDGCGPCWRDDAQVVELCARKVYASDGRPHWTIAVEADAPDVGEPVPSRGRSCARRDRGGQGCRAAPGVASPP